MNWHITLGLFYVTSVIKALSQRTYMRRSSLAPSIIAALAALIGIWPLGIIVSIMLPHSISWSWTTIGLLLIQGFCIGIYGKLSYTAIKRLPISQFQTLNQSFNIFIIILGWLVLGETLTLLQLGGSAFIIASAVVVGLAAHVNDKKNKTQTGAVRLVVIAAAILSVGLIAEKAALGHMDMGAYFIFGFGAQALTMLALAIPDLRKNTHHISQNDIKNFFIMGAASATVGFMYLYTVKAANNISLIVTLNSFALPLTALASYWLLHERENTKELWIAITLGVIGIIIMAL